MNEKEALNDNFDDESPEIETTGEATSTDDSDSGVSMSDSVAAMADKEAERLQLQTDVEAFLARGGQIVEVPTNVISDPPKKPVSSYGGQSL